MAWSQWRGSPERMVCRIISWGKSLRPTLALPPAPIQT